MALLLHAITARTDATTPSPGLFGHPFIRLDEGELSGWATELSRGGEPFTRADLLDHHRLISEVWDHTDACLPARFPTWFDNSEALATQLRKREAQLARQLQEVSGYCELAVTVLWTRPEKESTVSEAATPGRRYLLERRRALAGSDQRHARARELADEIERLARPDLLRAERQLCPSATVALSSALLVRRSGAGDVQTRLRRSIEDVRILVNGPWPPYSFAAVRSD